MVVVVVVVEYLRHLNRSCLESDGTCGPRTRRSSIVVIPPMQICPGDLLVYSKVLTQRSNLLGIIIIYYIINILVGTNLKTYLFRSDSM